MDGSFGSVSLIRLRPFLKAPTCPPRPIKEAVQALGGNSEAQEAVEDVPRASCASWCLEDRGARTWGLQRIGWAELALEYLQLLIWFACICS